MAIHLEKHADTAAESLGDGRCWHQWCGAFAKADHRGGIANRKPTAVGGNQALPVLCGGPLKQATNGTKQGHSCGQKVNLPAPRLQLQRKPSRGASEKKRTRSLIEAAF